VGELMSHRVLYCQQHANVRFCGPVDTAQIFCLCDEIDSFISQYYYRHVILEIDSNGGELQSLLYYIQKLKGWRKQGVRIETVALTKCASAAAVMLSLGDIGHRYAMPRSKLLYHNARVYASSGIPLTSDKLEKLHSSLCRADAEILVALLQHLFSELDAKYFICLEELVCNLRYPENIVDGNVLAITGSPRIGRFIKGIEQSKDKENNQYLRTELYRTVSNHLKGLGGTLKDKKGVLKKLKYVDAESPYEKDALSMAWLFDQFEHYQILFERDTTMKSTDVISEGLIDRIKE
jgi:ATP-dependent protease ClpP protease subunit